MRSLFALLFRMVLSLFPRDFRGAYGAEMIEVFSERIAAESGLDLFLAGSREVSGLAIAAATYRMQSLTTIDVSRAAVLGLLMLVSGDALRSAGASAPGSTGRIDFSAHDPAGNFTLTILDGRPVAATMNSVRLPAERIVQDGDSIRVFASTGIQLLALSFDRETGRLEWNPRPAKCEQSTIECASRR